MSRRTAYLSLAALLLAVLMSGCGGSGGGGSSLNPSAVAPQGSTGFGPSELKAITELSAAQFKATLEPSVAQLTVTAPWVVNSTPMPAATNVGINSSIIVTFNQPMNPSTITRQTFTITAGTTAVSGAVSLSPTYQCATAVFVPAKKLAPSTVFTATITTGVKNVAGTALASAYVWHFTTGTHSDTTPPSVVATGPPDNSVRVGVNRYLTASFDQAIDPSTITSKTFSLKQGITPVPGLSGCMAGLIAYFIPTTSLAPYTVFTATLSTGVRDLAGNALASPHVWVFTTGERTNVNPPYVVQTSPTSGARAVPLNAKITATFNEMILPTTIWAARFTLKQGATPVLGTVTYNDRTATFRPAVSLLINTTYTATIQAGIRDRFDHALMKDYVWSFNTGPAGVNLRSAGAFAVLAGSTVTNTALLTTVNGDLGVSPGTAVTGFPPGVVNGTMHKGDPIAAQAKLDLTAAYNDAAGRSTAPVTVAGNLGGQTIYPGLYKSTSTLAISSGDLTLDARGDYRAVFIFQMASTFTMTSGRQIILKGGAKPANIYWQVGSSATLGSTSVFKGNILSDISITLNTGATVDGRLLTRTGAITLDGNTINRP